MTEEKAAGAMERWNQWLIAAAATFVLHYAWEMGQAPWFRELAGLPFSAHLVRCWVATLGDMVIAAGAYAVASLLFRRPRWPFLRRWYGPALVWIASGLAVTIGFEHWALSVGRWSYTEAMPTIAGIGFLPLLQWIVVPTGTLLIVRFVAVRMRTKPQLRAEEPNEHRAPGNG